MSMEFVGKEALPNAYVKSIELNQSGKDFFSLTVVANIFDFINDSGETSWLDPSNAIIELYDPEKDTISSKFELFFSRPLS